MTIEEYLYMAWILVGKLKNGFPHGCPEWKENIKIKKQVRKLLWDNFNK